MASSSVCNRDDCRVCESDKRGLCCKEGVGYSIWCPVCQQEGLSAVMHGETGKSARVRIGQHLDAYEKGKNSNLYEHCAEKHNGQAVKFECKVTGVFKDPLSRQLDEALRIQREDGLTLNDKYEWIRPAGHRMVAEKM